MQLDKVALVWFSVSASTDVALVLSNPEKEIKLE